MMIGKTMYLASQRMARGTGNLVEKVVAEVDVADMADLVYGVVIHVMRAGVFEDTIGMKKAED
jgi:hypothetical protein